MNIDIKKGLRSNIGFVVIMVLFGALIPIEGISILSVTIYNPFFYFFFILNIYLNGRKR